MEFNDINARNAGKIIEKTTASTLHRLQKKQLVETYIQSMLRGETLRKDAKETGISLVTAFNMATSVFVTNQELPRK